MKRMIIILGVSIGTILFGTIAFSINKVKKWAKLFNLSYSEFSRALGIGTQMLLDGRPIDEIKSRTGIDFSHPEVAKYFPSNNPINSEDFNPFMSLYGSNELEKLE
jgi:hypothetical protein